MRRFLVAAALAALGLLATAPAAVAADGPAAGCQLTPAQCAATQGGLNNPAAGVQAPDDVPPLQRPDMVASLVGCDWGHPGPAGDPFAKNGRVTLFSQYCYAGYATPTTYDLGVVDRALNEPEARFDAALLEPAVTVTSAADGLWAQAFNPTWLGVFDDLSKVATDHIDPLVRRYMPLAMLFAVIALARVTGDGDPVKAWTGLAMSVLCVVVALAALGYPMLVARTAQSSLEAVAVQMNADVDGAAPAADSAAGRASEATLREVHYRGWLRRSFGSPDIPAAQRFGPPLFKAGTMTLAETKTCRGAPVGPACQKVYDDHAAAYRKVAKDIKAADPVAYRALQGKTSRTGATLLELAGALIAALVRSIAAGLVILAVMVLVILALVVPLGCLKAVVEAGQGRMDTLSGMGAVAGNAIIAGGAGVIVGPLFAGAVGAILGATVLPWWFAMATLALLSAVVLSYLKPWQRLQAMTSISRSDAKRAKRRGSSLVWRAAKTAAGVAFVHHEAGEVKEAVNDAPTPQPATTPAPSAPPMPPMVERLALPEAPRRWVAPAPEPVGGSVLPGRVVTDEHGRDVWVADLDDVYVPRSAT